jgi:hypothetical protein
VSTETGGFEVDSVMPPEWTESTRLLLDKWIQGSLVQGLPVHWSASSADDPVTGAVGAKDDLAVVSSRDLSLDWAILTSQTCDISAEGPGSKHPFVQVSPVLPIPQAWSEAKRDAIRDYSVTYLAPINSPILSGEWMTDLRISLPVSKGLLLERDPAQGFVDESERLRFSEHMAARIRRPALHSALTEDLSRALVNYIGTTKKSEPEWWHHVNHLRLLVSGDRLSPTMVRVLVVEELELENAQRKIWRDFLKIGKRTLKPSRISMGPFLFYTLDKLSARMYCQSVPLFIPQLGSDRAGI